MIKQISEESSEESAWFTLADFLTLEFKSCLYIGKHEYLKFVSIILFVNDHGFDAILELIRSEML